MKDIQKKFSKLHEPKGYFIHIPKTGGTYVWKKKWIAKGGISLNDSELRKTGHRSCVPRKAKYGDFVQVNKTLMDSSISFTVVRNPYDLLASYYHSDKNGDMVGWRWCNRDHNFKSFKEFIVSYCDPEFKWNVKPLHDNLFFQIFDKDGKCAVDLILRHELLDDGLDYFGGLFGVETYPAERINASTNRKKVYSDLYDEEMVELVNKKCSKELSLFGYSFSGHDGKAILEV